MTTVNWVVFKDEGDFGFIHVLHEGEEWGKPRAFDPDRPQQYGTIREAMAIAEEHDVPLMVI